MKMARRRFLSICALATGGAALGLRERPMRWSGLALGAHATIEIAGGEPEQLKLAMQAALNTIRRMESLFSIYDPQSAVSRLNRDGIVAGEPEFQRLAGLVSEAHAMTDGLFDPTIQVLFAARLQGRKPGEAEFRRVGWHHVVSAGDHLRFARAGMAVTFNGIAQGFATDRVSEVLATFGYDATLVNIGEYRAGAREARIGVGTDGNTNNIVVPLAHAAIATSSAQGYRFADGGSHILHPQHNAFYNDWANATVVHKTAAMADAFSTALILSDGTALARRLRLGGCERVILQDQDGRVVEA